MADGKSRGKADRRKAAQARAAKRRRRLIWEIAFAIALLMGFVAFLVITSRGGTRRDAPVTPVLTAAPTAEVTAEPEIKETRAPTPTPTATPEPTPTPTATPVPTPVPQPVKMDYPYAIVVDRGAQVVTVLTVGQSGKYDLIARQMICSTDKYGWKPGNGIYKMHGQRKRWMSTLTGSYVQYATRISGTILFHSIPYTKEDPSKIMWQEYMNLGKAVSEGCVRLTCEDAKWIYENVPTGTLVMFKEGNFDAFTLDGLQPPALVSGAWDPTDDNGGNPDYIGRSYHLEPLATPYPGVSPAPTSYAISKWD